VVGVWRDHSTGEKLVAVVWDAENSDGGSWIQFDDLHLGAHPVEIALGVEDSDDDEAFAIPGAEIASNGDTMRWHREFGSGLVEGTQLVVQWVQPTRSRPVFKNFLGELSGDFDSGTHSHEISYRRCIANKNLHTLGNPKADSHWMNLASLEVDNENEGDAEATEEFFSFWVKASHVKVPFIAKHLFDAEPDPVP
jgi:hypothetical protein